MGFGIDRRARSRKGKGLFRRAPDPKEVGNRLGWLLRRMDRRAKVRTRLVPSASPKGEREDDRIVAEVQYHDAAPAAKLVVGADAELHVCAETAALGPGYHADILARLTPILDELDFVWTEPDPDPVVGITAWLAGELRRDGTIRIGLGDERTFHCDAPILTLLGPRDAAWRDAVLADPARGADAFPWWRGGAGTAERASALIAMWIDVPWREPFDNDEIELMKRVDAELTAARAADATLDLPYAEWGALLDYLNETDAHADAIRKLAAGRAPSIGYRRYDIDVALSGGWIVRMPGSFVGTWEDDGGRYWATDGERVIEFTSLTAEDETDSDKLLAVAPERHTLLERRSEGTLRARAEVSDEDDIHIVHGLAADAPHVAILTCKGRTSDEPWALATWRSLRRA